MLVVVSVVRQILKTGGAEWVYTALANYTVFLMF